VQSANRMLVFGAHLLLRRAVATALLPKYPISIGRSRYRTGYWPHKTQTKLPKMGYQDINWYAQRISTRNRHVACRQDRPSSSSHAPELAPDYKVIWGIERQPTAQTVRLKARETAGPGPSVTFDAPMAHISKPPHSATPPPKGAQLNVSLIGIAMPAFRFVC